MHPMNDFLSTAFPGMSFEFVADNAAGISSDCSNHHHCSITPTTAAKVAPSQPRRKRSILSTPPNDLLRKHLEARWEPVTSDDDDDDDSSDDNNTQSSSRRSSAPIAVSRPPVITNKARSSSDSAVQSYPEEFARSRQRRRRTDVAVSQPVRKVSDNNTPPKQRRGSGTKPKKQHPRKQLQQRSEKKTSGNMSIVRSRASAAFHFELLNKVHNGSRCAVPTSMDEQLELVLNQAMAITSR